MSPSILGLPAYRLFVAVAIVIGVGLTLHAAARAGLSPGRLLLLQITLAVAGLAGARMHSLLETGGWRSPLTSGGYRYAGGIVAVLAVLPFTGRIRGPAFSVGAVADVVAAPIAFATATVRVGCLLHGCCYGGVSRLPWALRFPAGSPAWNDHVAAGLLARDAAWSLPVHPLQVYLGVWSLAIGLALVAWRSRKAYDGQLFLFFLAFHDGGKFLLELLRAPAPLWHLEVPAALFALTGVTLLLITRARPARGAGGA